MATTGINKKGVPLWCGKWHFEVLYQCGQAELWRTPPTIKETIRGLHILLGSLSVTVSSVVCEAAEHLSQSEHGTLEERVQIFSLIEGIQIRFAYFQAEVQQSLCRLWRCPLSGKHGLEIHYIWYSYLNYPQSAIYTTWWPVQVVHRSSITCIQKLEGKSIYASTSAAMIWPNSMSHIMQLYVTTWKYICSDKKGMVLNFGSFKVDKSTNFIKS